jgi:hypothetical protein
MMPDDLWERLRDAQDATREHAGNVRSVRERMPSRPPVEPATRRWLAIPAVLALAAAVALAVTSLRPGRSVLFFEVGHDKQTGHIGTWIAAPDGAELPIRFFDGSAITVAPKSRARVTSLEATGAHVLLERGRADVAVVHRDNTRWEIAAGPFQVSVLGTRFTVSWDPDSEVLRLQLREGQVLVSGSFLQNPQRVSKGQTLRAFCRQGRSEIVELQNGLDADPPSGAASSTPPPTVVQPDALAPRGDGELRSSEPRATQGLRQSSWLDLAAVGKFREAVESAEHDGFEAECRRASGRDLLTLGDAARLAKNPARARQAYLAARDKLPGGGRATYGLGLVAFDQQLDLADAAKWFEMYVARNAKGGLRSEAQGRLIEAYQRLGNPEKARRVAEQYLVEYPTGAHAALARQLTSR